MKHYNDADSTSKLLEAFSGSARPTLTVDVAKYQEYLDGSDLTPEQKEEFLNAVWSIVVTFVELGYGVHPLQEACGKDSAAPDQGAKEARNRLNSDDPNKPTY
tara:strand:- start:99 stop:407 length:309 start_codon:yes stop_codon:yes gene_type:complete